MNVSKCWRPWCHPANPIRSAAARLCLLLAACVCCVIECSAISRIYPLFFEFTTTCPCPLDLGLWGVPLNHFRTVRSIRSDLFLAARAWIYFEPEPPFSLVLVRPILGDRAAMWCANASFRKRAWAAMEVAGAPPNLRRSQ